ncbi:uncharacterized protein LOC108626803 [Ceratina calcarata]|uniref:Uncharacterized protein LOC108626803 n=1 Tax=Ceratina calcarata TaxID=156304 RepID=A0AAJ7N8Q0_9HYME|nr:uncharacterized protein LOC108626803 [Ceratina calcarata]
MSKSIVRKRRIKRKTYWCAPRKVKSISIIENVDKDPPVENKKSKKKRCKKKQRNIKKLRRIDILALPKTIKTKLENKSRFLSVNDSARKVSRPPVIENQKSYIYSRKRARMKKVKTNMNVPKNCKMNLGPRKRHSQIVLPKKMGIRLFSLVKKRLKEITNDFKTV